MSALLWFAKVLAPDYFSMAKKSNQIQVITIGFSHYCEFACWALKASRKPFIEHGYAPGQHVLPVLKVRLCDPLGVRHLSKSSRVTSLREKAMLNEKGEQLTPEEAQIVRKRDASARSTAVPVAILPSGQVLLDSWEIAEYSGLAPAPAEWQNIFDNELGPLARQTSYSAILKEGNTPIFNELCTSNRIWFWRWIWSLFAGNFITEVILKLFRPRDMVAVNAAKQDLHKVVQKLDVMVTQRKGKFLLGDELSLADIALASLLGPMLMPPLYCEGRFNQQFTKLYETDAEARKEIDEWRSTITGQYVLDLYSKHRL